jgi:hypothetical protein
MDLYCSAMFAVKDRPGCMKRLQCRTVPAARQTPCALDVLMRRSCSEFDFGDTGWKMNLLA